ncbi:MAG: hypothetical protein LLG20_18460 [Acidobacteriales bacterium]|nr:hypothetical protein [Terriglobales bacterium]
MPWTAAEAAAKTHKANTPAKRKAWAAQANAILARTGDEAMAIKIANSHAADTSAQDKPVSLADMMTAAVKARRKRSKK